MKYTYRVGQDVVIVKDLIGVERGVVGLTARVEELLPVKGRHPQYKVLVFGEKGVRGGMFEVDERELGWRASK